MTLKTKLYAALMLLCVVLAWLPMQAGAGEQLNQMLKVTLSVFALARSLNAVISVAQGTEMSIEPMGVGLTLTPGEILDPLNDLIEQFSSVLLLASASLGIQKIILSFGDLAFLRWGLAVLAMVTLVLFLSKGLSAASQQRMVKLVIVLTVLRLSVPALAVTSHQFQNWLGSEREQALQVLQATQENVDEINSQTAAEEPSWLEGFKNRLDINARLNKVQQKAEQGVEAAVYLLAEFVLIMVLLPILFAYLMLKLLGRVTMT